MKNIILVLSTFFIISCSNKPSLQKYFVEKSENPEFIAVDIASSIINTDKISLTTQEEEALKSFDKINVLAYKKDSLQDIKVVEEERNNVKSILKDETYQELIKFGNPKNEAKVYLVGETDKIDEVVIYASGKEEGFVVARVLGDNMTPNTVLNLIEVIKKADLDLEQLKPLQEALGKK